MYANNRSNWIVTGHDGDLLGIIGKIGLEVEFFGFDANSGARIGEAQATKIANLITRSPNFFGHLSFEPGYQIEYSSMPATSIEEIYETLNHSVETLVRKCESIGVVLDSAGFYDEVSDSRVPENLSGRYKLLKSYLCKRSSRTRDMMFNTAGVHVNLDSRTLAVCGQNYILWNLLDPIVAALSGNDSSDGGSKGLGSRRSQAWLGIDPMRIVPPQFVFARRFEVNKYLRYLDEVPAIDESGAPTRLLDHLRSIYTPCRLKPGITEIRSFDSDRLPNIMAAVALCVGISVDQEHRDKALTLVPEVTVSEYLVARTSGAQNGLKGYYAGQSLILLAKRLIEIAEDGLNSNDPRAQRYLDPLKDKCRDFELRHSCGDIPCLSTGESAQNLSMWESTS